MTICEWRELGFLRRLHLVSTDLLQPVDGLLVGDGKRIRVVLRQRHDQTCHSERHTLFTAASVPSLIASRQRTHHVLVIHDRDDARGPLVGRDDLGVLAVEPQERERCLFPHKAL